MFLFFVCLCDVEGACSKGPFYHVFGSSAGFCAVSWVFGWASLYDTDYRCVVGNSGRFVGARGVDWDEIGGCSGGWSNALGVSFYSDAYG